MPVRQYRLRSAADFRRVVRGGKRVGGALCTTHAFLHVSARPAAFGYIVTRAYGNAVQRNLVRRRLKSIVDAELREGFSGADIVFRVSPKAASATFSELEREITRSLKRVRGWISAGTDEALETSGSAAQS